MSTSLRRLVGALILVFTVGLSGTVALRAALEAPDETPASTSSAETLDA